MKSFGLSSQRLTFSSQIVSSLTNFVTSVSAIMFLSSGDFRKWYIYVTSTLAIQGVMRTSLFESDLMDFGGIQERHKFLILKVSLLPFLMIPVVSLVLRIEISFVDFALSLYCFSVLVQDACRYVFLGSKPEIALLSDSIWLVSSLVLLSLVIFHKNLIQIPYFLMLTVCGPFFALLCIFLFWKICAGIIIVQGTQRSNDRERRYLAIQSIYGTIIAIVANFIIAKYCSSDQLYIIRVIQAVSSPFQALALAYWLTIVNSGRNSMLVVNVIRMNIARMLRFFLIFGILLYAIEVSSKNFDLDSPADQGKTLLVAISIPIFNAAVYSSTYTLRYFRKYKEMMISSIMVSSAFVFAIVSLKDSLNALVFFLLQFASIIVLQSLYIRLCFSLRNKGQAIQSGVNRFGD
jgi:hypothetical protein